MAELNSTINFDKVCGYMSLAIAVSYGIESAKIALVGLSIFFTLGYVIFVPALISLIFFTASASFFLRKKWNKQLAKLLAVFLVLISNLDASIRGIVHLRRAFRTD